MPKSRSRSAARPRRAAGLELDLDDFPRSVSPEIASSLVRLVTRAEAMGLIDPAGQISGSRVFEALDALAEAGIGLATVDQAKVDADPRRAVEALNEALIESPTPRPTLRHLSDVIGLRDVARLVGTSEASARRYLAGTREVPDEVAWRLHVVALVVADLAGSYNAFGIRRWFSRSRPQLRGRAPRDILTGAWGPDSDDVRAVRELAAALISPVAS